MSEYNDEKRILSSIISSIESGKNPVLLNHETKFRNFLSLINEGNYHSELSLFFQENPEIADHCLQNTFDRTVDFVKREIDRISRIKRDRPLSDNEKQYGHKILIPLLERLSGLFVKE